MSRPLRVGLTGSIGMGKSTTAALFAEQGIAVYDADAAVHRVYGPEGAAVSAVEALFPGVSFQGAIDRSKLGPRVLGDPDALRRLEAVVHPLLAADRAIFLAETAAAPLVVLDVPLLFETGGERSMDAVVVVSAPAQVQHERVMLREGMNQAKLDAILARQTPDEEKRKLADFVIDTGAGLEAAQTQVKSVLGILADPRWRSRFAEQRASR